MGADSPGPFSIPAYGDGSKEETAGLIQRTKGPGVPFVQGKVNFILKSKTPSVKCTSL